MSKITEFQGEYRWLSNFWPVEVEYDGLTYPSVENAYQSSKFSNLLLNRRFMYCSPGESKRLARDNDDLMNNDFHKNKLAIMRNLLYQKFQYDDLKEKLIQTHPNDLIEGNSWNDTFWGVCNGEGHNNLGKLLMSIRLELL